MDRNETGFGYGNGHRSRERGTVSGNRWPEGQQPPRINSDKVLHESSVEGARKTFRISVRENAGGKFIRLQELKGGRLDMVIIPDDMAQELLGHLAHAAELLTPAS
jgi:hypothetical protein